MKKDYVSATVNFFEREMVYFQGGEIVRVKQDIPNRPNMVVKKVIKAKTNDNTTLLVGVRCFWFNAEGSYMEQIFNSKDLTKC